MLLKILLGEPKNMHLNKHQSYHKGARNKPALPLTLQEFYFTLESFGIASICAIFKVNENSKLSTLLSATFTVHNSDILFIQHSKIIFKRFMKF